MPSAQARTKHSNSSLPLPSGGHLDFVWARTVGEVVAAARELLAGVRQGRVAGGRAVLVVGVGVWDMVVHLTPLASFVRSIEPLLEATRALAGAGARVVWLSPVPRTVEKKGVLPGAHPVAAPRMVSRAKRVARGD